MGRSYSVFAQIGARLQYLGEVDAMDSLTALERAKVTYRFRTSRPIVNAYPS